MLLFSVIFKQYFEGCMQSKAYVTFVEKYVKFVAKYVAFVTKYVTCVAKYVAVVAKYVTFLRKVYTLIVKIATVVLTVAIKHHTAISASYIRICVIMSWILVCYNLTVYIIHRIDGYLGSLT